MKRIHPLAVIVLVVVLLVGGILWKVMTGEECIDRDGVVIGPLTRVQFCAEK